MKLKTVLSVLPMMALLASPVFANEVPEFTNEDIQLQEQYDDTDTDNTPVRIEGTVTDVAKSDNQLEVDVTEEGTFSVDTEHAIFIKGRRISDIDAVEVGDEVLVTSLEQRSSQHLIAKGVLIQTEGAFINFHIDKFSRVDDGLVSADFSLRIQDQDYMLVIDEQGEEVELSMEDLHGRNLAVIYGAATFSIPAIPLQPTIILLEDTNWDDVEPVEMPTVDPIRELEPQETEQKPTDELNDNIINMLDLLPFWARGGHVNRPQIHVEVPMEGTDEDTSDVVEEVIEDIEDIIDENYFIGIEVIIEEDEVVVEAGQ